MKKLIALLLILSSCTLCFLVSCRDKNDDDNNQNDQGSGEIEGGENNDDPIIDIGSGENNSNGGGILNEDNIDPNGWTKVD